MSCTTQIVCSALAVALATTRNNSFKNQVTGVFSCGDGVTVFIFESGLSLLETAHWYSYFGQRKGLLNNIKGTAQCSKCSFGHLDRFSGESLRSTTRLRHSLPPQTLEYKKSGHSVAALNSKKLFKTPEWFLALSRNLGSKEMFSKAFLGYSSNLLLVLFITFFLEKKEIKKEKHALTDSVGFVCL